MDELCYASATALARAIRSREVSSEEVVSAHLRRIDQVNPAINAMMRPAPDALERARAADAAVARSAELGPLHGVPFTIKDSFDTAGLITTYGTLGKANHVPARDAPVVARLRAAGGILLGKTNLPELCLIWECENRVAGRTHNPYDLSRMPGSSSGGEGAIIAAGGSPLGIGSDIGGSIRWPAHCCGIAGLKPTNGRVPTTGHTPGALGYRTHLWGMGPMARRVEDLVLALPLLAGPDGRDPTAAPVPLGDPSRVDVSGLRVAYFSDHAGAPPTAETRAAVRACADVLTDSEARVEEAQVPGFEQVIEVFSALSAAQGGAQFHALLATVGTTEPHPGFVQVMEQFSGREYGAHELSLLIERWHQLRATMLEFLDRFDVVICPANSFPAPRHGTAIDKEFVSAFDFLMLFNLNGWPAAVVRAGTSPEGLPIGVQVGATPWQEHVALAVAQEIEAALGGWQRPPL